jgi:hypothetical protein
VRLAREAGGEALYVRVSVEHEAASLVEKTAA